MPSLSEYANLEWFLSSNRDVLEEFSREWGWNASYLSYLDNLVAQLRIQTVNLFAKMEDVGDLEKFDSLVAELELAEALCRTGKRVEFLTDSYMGSSRSPDMISRGSPRDALVEVRMLRDEEVEGRLLKRLRNFLSGTNYIVNVHLSLDISDSSRPLRQRSAEIAVEEFEEQFTSSLMAIPPKIVTPYAIFYPVKKSEIGPGYPGIIDSSTITVPTDILRRRVAESVLEKAAKREDWDSAHKQYLYLIGVASRDCWLDQDDVEQALIGSGTYFVPPLTMPSYSPSLEIRRAQASGWSSFLQQKCVIPNGNTVILPEQQGIYFTDVSCRNVSGVISMFRNWNISITPNPFAETLINEPRLTTYV